MIFFIKISGGSDFNPDEHYRLPDDHFSLTRHTFWEEFLFLSDHGDSPKVLERNCVVVLRSDFPCCRIGVLYVDAPYSASRTYEGPITGQSQRCTM